jgi:hypothetical protein
MKRLPGYDCSTRRSEWAAFGCLGAVAVAAIFLSLPNASKFAEERDDVITAWSLAGAAEPVLAGHRTNHMVTRASYIPAGVPAEQQFLFRNCATYHDCPAMKSSDNSRQFE